jgi:hypothetical protein
MQQVSCCSLIWVQQVAGRRQHNWKSARSGGSTMVWLGMILAMILAQSLQGWSEWGIRITVLSSLGANLY